MEATLLGIKWNIEHRTPNSGLSHGCCSSKTPSPRIFNMKITSPATFAELDFGEFSSTPWKIQTWCLCWSIYCSNGWLIIDFFPPSFPKTSLFSLGPGFPAGRSQKEPQKLHSPFLGLPSDIRLCPRPPVLGTLQPISSEGTVTSSLGFFWLLSGNGSLNPLSSR